MIINTLRYIFDFEYHIKRRIVKPNLLYYRLIFFWLINSKKTLLLRTTSNSRIIFDLLQM